MTLLSLALITLWMVMLVLGWNLAGFVHTLLGAAVTIVMVSGRKGGRRARVAAAATAAAATAATAATSLTTIPR